MINIMNIFIFVPVLEFDAGF